MPCVMVIGMPTSLRCMQSHLLLHAYAALLGKPGLDSTVAWLQVFGRV